ncbi:phosphatase PAP2 family protein [Streptomyces sp. NBC_01537]|uniref:phosphatase PAP2 family protein n=1 Tax=Streptomyces sp. NBC_01537 TaxID=2903896 RepID=UPI00386DC62B
MHDAPLTEAPAASARGACLRRLALLTVLFAVLLALVAVRWAPLMSLDRRIARGLHTVAVGHPALTHVNRVFTDWVWDPLTMRALLLAATLWMLRRRAWRAALWLAVCGVVGNVASQGMKAAVGRARPHWPDPVDSARYAAFPSGHAMTAAIVCGALLWLFLHRTAAGPAWRAAAWAVALVSVVGVGFTRVYLGVHWASDVVGGWLLGGVVLTGAAALCAPWQAGWRT